MSLDPMEPMNITNDALGGHHTTGDKGRPISEHVIPIPDDESKSLKLTTRARGPESDDHGPHTNFVTTAESAGFKDNEIALDDNEKGFWNEHIPVDESDVL